MAAPAPVIPMHVDVTTVQQGNQIVLQLTMNVGPLHTVVFLPPAMASAIAEALKERVKEAETKIVMADAGEVPPLTPGKA